MGNNLKNFFSIVLVATLCVCMTVTAYATCARYINEISARCDLDISGGEATLYSEMSGDAAITKVVMTHTLQKKSGSSYSNVSGASKTRTFYNDNIPYMSDTFSVTSGTYRVKTTYKVTSPNGTDTHTAYSSAVTY